MSITRDPKQGLKEVDTTSDFRVLTFILVLNQRVLIALNGGHFGFCSHSQLVISLEVIHLHTSFFSFPCYPAGKQVSLNLQTMKLVFRHAMSSAKKLVYVDFFRAVRQGE